MVNNELSTYRESEALATFLEENEGLVVNHGEAYDYEDKGIYFFICENKEAESKLTEKLHSLGFKDDFKIVYDDEHMKCEQCSKIIADWHTVVTHSEVLCLGCHNEQMKRTGEWRVVNGKEAYRYITPNIVSVITRYVEKEISDGGFGREQYYSLHYRVGNKEAINQDEYSKFFKEKPRLDKYSEDEFLVEYCIPKFVYYLMNLSSNERVVVEGVSKNIMNQEPLCEDDYKKLLKELTK